MFFGGFSGVVFAMTYFLFYYPCLLVCVLEVFPCLFCPAASTVYRDGDG